MNSGEGGGEAKTKTISLGDRALLSLCPGGMLSKLLSNFEENRVEDILSKPTHKRNRLGDVEERREVSSVL